MPARRPTHYVHSKPNVWHLETFRNYTHTICTPKVEKLTSANFPSYSPISMSNPKFKVSHPQDWNIHPTPYLHPKSKAVHPQALESDPVLPFYLQRRTFYTLKLSGQTPYTQFTPKARSTTHNLLQKSKLSHQKTFNSDPLHTFFTQSRKFYTLELSISDLYTPFTPWM